MDRDELLVQAGRIVNAVGREGLLMGLVTGSVARGLADASSDLDLYLYWELPDVPRLSSPARFEPLGARVAFGVPTATGWFSKLALGDRYVDVEDSAASVLHRARTTLAEAAPPPGWVVKLAAGIRDAVAVHGSDELAAWRDRLAYRDELAAAVANASSRRLLAPSVLFELTYVRDDVLSFSARLSSVLLEVVALLGAVNRWFVPTEDPKWIPWHLEQLTTCPPDLGTRMRDALIDPPARMADLDAAIGETLDLVDEHVPGASTQAGRVAVALRPRPR
jgi:hypothetical protein